MLDQAMIRQILPHRDPMLLVDRVDEMTSGETLVAVKAITATEPCYRAALAAAPPGGFAYPRPLIVESFCQSGALLWLAGIRTSGAESPGQLVFAVARDVVFHRHAYPGDVLRHSVRITKVVGDNAFLTGRTCIGDQPAMEVGTIVAAVRRPEVLERES
ncbi:3-hydroxyacyl-ACP dehydratase FabZ family protein [Nocardia noduli]|uniref:3-hydroxyacyl-ACP dehydratase FabZ family protein n=1 Tax=Nocardia noduli TaxID=2815722 RepID=UPI001C224863|nr:hypothetical protein [Nocardia noduli]